MLAGIHKIGFVSQFVNGHQLSPELEPSYPVIALVGSFLERRQGNYLFD